MYAGLLKKSEKTAQNGATSADIGSSSAWSSSSGLEPVQRAPSAQSEGSSANSGHEANGWDFAPGLLEGQGSGSSQEGIKASESQTSGPGRRPKRKRKAVEPMIFESLTYKEEKQLRLALEKSVQEVVAPVGLKPMEALILRPTIEEFKDPIAYVVKTRPLIYENGGIAKIVPPEGWNCPFELNKDVITFETKEQCINNLGEGLPYGIGSDYDVDLYKEMADKFRQRWEEKLKQRGEDITDLGVWERQYWRIVEGGEEEKVIVEYGNDVSTDRIGGGFPLNKERKAIWEENGVDPDFTNRDYYARSEWNLSNIARARGSILNALEDEINGINVPWLYFGMLFSTFSWHVEDHWFYSINYSHHGDVKLWYGVSPVYKEAFDFEMKRNMPVRFAEDPNLLSDITTMLNPAHLLQRGIPVVHLHQRPGEFVVTLPGAYHAGFSMGYNVGEAVNFAPLDWSPYGRHCRDFYRQRKRKPVIAHDKIIWALAERKVSEFDNAELELLSNELTVMLKQERDARTHVERDGVGFQVVMPPEDLTTDENDFCRLCFVCHQPNSLSAIVCACSVPRVSCLLHHRMMCSCPAGKKALVVYRTMESLQRIADNVKNTLELRTHATNQSVCAVACGKKDSLVSVS